MSFFAALSLPRCQHTRACVLLTQQYMNVGDGVVSFLLSLSLSLLRFYLVEKNFLFFIEMDLFPSLDLQEKIELCSVSMSHFHRGPGACTFDALFSESHYRERGLIARPHRVRKRDNQMMPRCMFVRFGNRKNVGKTCKFSMRCDTLGMFLSVSSLFFVPSSISPSPHRNGVIINF